MDTNELNRRQEERIIELKTRRTEVANFKLINWMKVHRSLASAVSNLIIQRANNIPDPLVPLHGNFPPGENKFTIHKELQNRKAQNASCCTIV